MDSRRRRRSRGQIAIMTAIMMPVMIGMLGIGIDAGMGYLLKARLSAAIDAASIAAARAATQGSTQAEQTTNAENAAKAFFDANMGGSYLGATVTWNKPTVTFDQGRVTVDTSASAVLPVSLMQILGFTTLKVNSHAQTVRKDVDMAFVVDTTGSLAPVKAEVKSSAKAFLDMLNATTDRVALIHFSFGGVVDVPFKADQSRGFDRTTMKSKIDGYSIEGGTNYSEGLWHARDQLNRVIQVGKRSSLRVVVFFTDGAPNSLGGRFAFRSGYTCTSPGAIYSGDGKNPSPLGPLLGLFRIDVQNDELSTGSCYGGYSIDDRLTTTALPAWFNAHDPAEQLYRIAPNPAGMRTVTTAPTFVNVNRASRNLAEQMAEQLRKEGIYVFMLGLGDGVDDPTGPDDERGVDLLKNMAHTVDSKKFALPQYADHPIGQYCWAATAADLTPCFAKLASEIMRISQ